MPKSASPSAALPIAHLLLRILIVVNWFSAVLILALLFVVPNAEWIIQALNLSPSLEADRVIFGLRSIAAIGLLLIPLNHASLKRLLAIVETVRAGDPFVVQASVTNDGPSIWLPRGAGLGAVMLGVHVCDRGGQILRHGATRRDQRGEVVRPKRFNGCNGYFPGGHRRLTGRSRGGGTRKYPGPLRAA